MTTIKRRLDDLEKAVQPGDDIVYIVDWSDDPQPVELGTIVITWDDIEEGEEPTDEPE
jgi:hypothetical protein